MAALHPSGPDAPPIAACSSSASSHAPSPGAASSHSAAASASGSGASSSSAAYVPLPDPLPPLPVDVLTRCDAAQRTFLHSALDAVHPSFRWSRTGMAAACVWSNRVAHVLLLGAKLNQGRVELHFPCCSGSGLPKLERIVLGEQHKHVGWEERGDRPAREWALLLPDSLVTRWLSEHQQLHPISTVQLTAAARVGLRACVEAVLVELAGLCGDAAIHMRCGVVTAAHLERACLNDEQFKHVQEYLGAQQAATLALAGPTAQPWVQQAASSIRSNPHLRALSTEFLPNAARLRALLSGAWFHDPQLVETYAQQYARLELPPGDGHFLRKHRIRPLAFFGEQLQTPPHRFHKRAVPTEAEERTLIEEGDTEVAPKLCRVFAFELLDVDGVAFPFVCYLWPMEDGNERLEAELFHAAADGTSLALIAQLRVSSWDDLYITFKGQLSEMPRRRRDEPPAPVAAPVQVETEGAGGSSGTRKRPRSNGREEDAEDEQEQQGATNASAQEAAPAAASISAALLPLPSAYGLTAGMVVLGHGVRSMAARGLDRSLMDECRRQQQALRIWQQQQQQQQQPEAELALDPHTAPAASSAAASSSDDAIMARVVRSIAEQRAKFLTCLPIAELEFAFLEGMNMVSYRRYSLELFPNLQPPAVRSYFTAALLDRASQAAGLPLMPLDLLRLIGEYEPADLPYMPNKLLPMEQVVEAGFVDQRVGSSTTEQEEGEQALL